MIENLMPKHDRLEVLDLITREWLAVLHDSILHVNIYRAEDDLRVLHNCVDSILHELNYIYTYRSPDLKPEVSETFDLLYEIKQVSIGEKYCPDRKGFQGMCCCNCKHQMILKCHPANDEGNGKGSTLDTFGYACTVAIDMNTGSERLEGSFMGNRKHGACELFTQRKEL